MFKGYHGAHMGGHGHGHMGGAHMGGAHMGQDEQTQRVSQLVEKKAQLEAALPVVDDSRAMSIEARLDQIDAQLAREISRAKAIGNEAAIRAALGVNGMGSLEFQVQSPAGKGRLLRLPFYAVSAPTSTAGSYVTSGGAAAADSTVPLINYVSKASGDAANIIITNADAITLQTPQISWATLRIVGFEVDIETSNNSNSTAATVANSITPAKLICKDLKIGGGANLLTHEDFGDAAIYDAAQPEFCGLRDYPLLKSPNVATVQVAVVGALTGNAGANGSSNLDFACSLLCEVLQDDTYGSSIPGPYARGAAMSRRGGSFLS